MKDVLGRELKVGDIVAFGSPNRGSVSVRIVAGFRERGIHTRTVNEVFVRGVSKIVSKYDREKREWIDIEPYLEMERGGWTFSDRVIVINESVPEEIKSFLQESINEQTETK